MQTRTYAELLDRIEALAGKDAFTTAEQTRLLSLVNARLYSAYRQCEYWPRYLTCEERYVGYKTLTVSGAGNDDVNGTWELAAGLNGAPSYERGGDGPLTFNADDGTWEMFFNVGGAQYTTGDDDILGTWSAGIGASPAPSVTGERPILPFSVTSATPVDTFLRIHKDNPYATNSTAEYSFWADSDGALIMNAGDIGATVWVTYKKRWSGPYAASATDIPQEFFEYAAHGAYADFLGSDGQNVPIKQAEDAAASQMLMLELSQAMQRYNVQNTSRRFSTYISQQAR